MNSSCQVTVAVLSIPNIIEVHSHDKGGTIFSGYEGKFLQAILSGLGCEFDIVIPADGQYGGLKPDGNWSGMVGMVHREEADLAFTTLAISYQRREIIDFSPTYENVAPTFAYRKPDATMPLFAYLYPFDIMIWASIFIFLFLLPVFFVIFSDKKIHYGTTFYKLFASLLGQALKVKFKSIHLNMLLCCWWITITVIPASYSAGLLSFLTVPPNNIPIKIFEELAFAVKKKTYKCYIIKGTSTSSFLRSSEKEGLKILGKEIILNEWYMSDSDMKNPKNLDENSVVILNSKKLQLFHGTNPEIFISSDTLSSWSSAVGMNKKFCYKSRLNFVVSSLVSAGIYGKFFNEESFKLRIFQLKEAEEQEDSNKSLSVKDLAGVFLLLFVGHSIAAISLLGEIIHSRRDFKQRDIKMF